MHRSCQEAVGEDGTRSVNTISMLPCNVDYNPWTVELGKVPKALEFSS
jgi:hypothetical protein